MAEAIAKYADAELEVGDTELVDHAGNASALSEFLLEEGAKHADEGYAEPPEPYDETSVPVGKREWVPDFHDQIVPRRKGFISDYVYHTRGVMVPTLAAIWSALFVMQNAIKREAWLAWYPNRLYLNQYLLIIGKAGLAKKTTAITEFGLPMLEGFRNYIRNRNVYELKRVEIVKDKTTPEALLTAMLPESRPAIDYFFRNADGTLQLNDKGVAIQVTRTSETAMVVSELVTMLGSSTYTRTMVEILLDLYDPKDVWEWRTEKRGVKKLRKTFLSLVAGTTVDGFRDSVPQAAKGDGFLSRMILCYVPESKRKYATPFHPKGAPTMTEMQRRLAWVSEHTLGEFEFAPEALRLFERWWETYYARLSSFPEYAGATSRMDVNVRKVAMMIRANRYEATEPVIDQEDVLDAIRLVEATYASLPFLMGQLNEDVVLRYLDKFSEYIAKKGEVNRQQLLNGMKIRSDVATIVLNEMVARGTVAVLTAEGKEAIYVSGKCREVYRWIGASNDGVRKAEQLWSAASFLDAETGEIVSPGGRNTRSFPHSTVTLDSGKPLRPSKKRRGRPAG